MKYRVYRRVGTKYVKFNISKSGVSTSVKLGRVTINPQRNRITYNTPIKGISLYDNIYDETKTTSDEDDGVGGIIGILLGGIALMILMGFLGI